MTLQRCAAFLAALVICSWCMGADPEPSFRLELVTAVQSQFAGVAGEVFGPFEVSAALQSDGLPGPDGVQSWSIGVRHSHLLELIQLTVDGTVAGDRLDPRDGFLHLEIIEPSQNGGQEGYIAQAVLSAGGAVTLPPDHLSTLVSATYRGIHPAVAAESETDLTFEYVDGLEGSGDPVVNQVQFQGRRYLPGILPLTRKLRTTPSCNVGITLELTSPSAVLEGDQWRLNTDLPAGQDLLLDVTAVLSLSLSGKDGPEGWTISVKHDRPFFELLSATSDGTDVLLHSNPDQRFIKTEIVDGEDGAGFISVVVLSLDGPRTLPANGQFSIARARYRLSAPHDEPGGLSTTPIRFEDGLRHGATAPVDNIVPIDGRTQKACRKTALQVEVTVVPGGKIFARGDASNDGRLNVADAVRMIRNLFFASPAFVCTAAADTNADLRFDSSDPVFLLGYIFLHGPKLPNPAPACGPDPSLDDPLPCEETAVRCP